MNKLRHHTLLVLALLVAFALSGLVACSEGNPVAPEGTTLTITANPSSIPLGGASEIIVIGRKPDGNPLVAGTEIRLSTSLGSIDGIVEADESGVARAVLLADNRAGSAEVTATTGDGMTSVMTSVQIGESAETQLVVTLTAEPGEISLGETSRISAIVRRPDGSPASAGQIVRFFSSLGSITPNASTDGDGIAVAILNSGDEAGTAQITAFSGSSAAAETSVEIERDGASRVIVQIDPQTITRSAPAPVRVDVLVLDQDGDPFGGARVTFSTVESVGGFDSQAETTNSDGEARNFYRVEVIPPDTDSITIRASVPSSAGGSQDGQQILRVVD